MKAAVLTAHRTVRTAAMRAAAGVAAVTVLIAGRCRADVVMLQENMIEIEENQIISWVFENHSTVASARSSASDLLRARIELAEQACTLSPEQRTRLELAGQGDIHRFFNKFEAMRRTSPSGKMTQQEYQNLWQRLQPMCQEFAQGLHTNDSLFVKSMQSTLDHEQLRQFEEFERVRNRRHYVAMVKGVIAVIENEIPLTAKQRKQLEELILARDPPRKSILHTPYKFYVVLYRVSKIPREQLRPVFLENEWAVMSGILQQAESMEQFFQQQGIEFE